MRPLSTSRSGGHVSFNVVQAAPKSLRPNYHSDNDRDHNKDPKRVMCAQPRGDISFVGWSYPAHCTKQLLSGRRPPYRTVSERPVPSCNTSELVAAPVAPGHPAPGAATPRVEKETVEKIYTETRTTHAASVLTRFGLGDSAGARPRAPSMRTK